MSIIHPKRDPLHWRLLYFYQRTLESDVYAKPSLEAKCSFSKCLSTSQQRYAVRTPNVATKHFAKLLFFKEHTCQQLPLCKHCTTPSSLTSKQNVLEVYMHKVSFHFTLFVRFTLVQKERAMLKFMFHRSRRSDIE